MRRELRRRLFSALYAPGARVYDGFVRRLFLGEWERWQDTALKELPNEGVVVELGSGTGAFVIRSSLPTRVWVGCEASAAMVRIAGSRPGAAGSWFVRADARALPLADAVADAIVGTFPTGYILDHRTAHEARRVLKPGGRIVVVLTGALAAHGIGRRARRCALCLFYGRDLRNDSGLEEFELTGFEGTTHRVTTDHGEAVLYVGAQSV